LFERFDHQLAQIGGVSVPGKFAGGARGVCGDRGAERRILRNFTNGGGELVGVFLISE
jgi:hypothetical protein